MLNQITRASLREASGPPTDLAKLGASLGVVEVEWKEMKVDGMVLPKGSGFKVILKSSSMPSRARFSWAHELGHVLLQKETRTEPHFRSAPLSHKKTEELCDKIAAEILMPMEQFREYMERSVSTLAAVPELSKVFDASILATAIRYTDLLPMPAVLSVWKSESQQLQFSWPHANAHCKPYRFGIPKGTRARETGRAGPYMAFQSSDVVRTDEALLVTRKYRDGERHKWLKYPTESMGIGSYQNRYVLSLSYVDVPYAGKANRKEPPN